MTPDAPRWSRRDLLATGGAALLAVPPCRRGHLRPDGRGGGGLLYGSVGGRELFTDAAYRDLFLAAAALITPEHASKFDALQPREGHFDFAGADALVDWARGLGLLVRGHTLIWNDRTPSWLASLSRREVERAFDGHLEAVVPHFAGCPLSLDVVDELFWLGRDRPGTFRPDPTTTSCAARRWRARWRRRSRAGTGRVAAERGSVRSCAATVQCSTSSPCSGVPVVKSFLFAAVGFAVSGTTCAGAEEPAAPAKAPERAAIERAVDSAAKEKVAKEKAVKEKAVKEKALIDDMTATLRKAGFTDLQILPNSVLVRGKDKAGHPVAMVLNPGSMTEMVVLDPHAGTAAGGNGTPLTGSGTFAAVLPGQRLASALIGLSVADASGQTVGTIKDIAIDHGGLHAYVLGIGGLFGIGDHDVAVTPGALQLSDDGATHKLRATVDATADQLKTAPAFADPAKR